MEETKVIYSSFSNFSYLGSLILFICFSGVKKFKSVLFLVWHHELSFLWSTQANVVCVVYDVTSEETINKVLIRFLVYTWLTPHTNSPCYGYQQLLWMHFKHKTPVKNSPLFFQIRTKWIPLVNGDAEKGNKYVSPQLWVCWGVCVCVHVLLVLLNFDLFYSHCLHKVLANFVISEVFKLHWDACINTGEMSDV